MREQAQALVSVVVAVYDVHAWLETCLNSVLNQTHARIEVIAVDDGSTDGSGDVCDRFAATDLRLRVVHKPNGGLSDARNAGLAEAAGDWVMFLDGDDWIEPDAIDRMLARAADTSADVIVAGLHVDVHDAEGALVTHEQRTPPPLVVEPGRSPAPPVTSELINVIGYAWNKLYRRQVLDEVGEEFAIGVSLVEDILFNAPVLSRTRVAFLGEAFVHYVQRPRPTLGTRAQPEFAQLMTRASKATSGLLTAWGVAPCRVSELIADVEVDRVQWALRSALTTSAPILERLAAARALLADPNVRSALAHQDRLGHGRCGLRAWLLATQSRGYVVPTWLALCARGRR